MKNPQNEVFSFHWWGKRAENREGYGKEEREEVRREGETRKGRERQRDREAEAEIERR